MHFKNDGFTLIEIMIAVVLLAFLTFAVVRMTDNSFDVKDRTLKQDENNLKIYSALQRMDWDVSHAYSPLYYEKLMEPSDLAIKNVDTSNLENQTEEARTQASLQASTQIYENLKQRLSGNKNFQEISVNALPVPNYELRSKDDFSFFTIANRRKFSDSKEAYYAWVRYRLESQPAREDDNPELSGLSRLVRYFVPQDPFSLAEIDFDKVKPFTILRNVKSLKFEFWSMKNEKFVDSLKETGEPFVIRALKTTIVWVDDYNTEQETQHIMTPLYPFFDLIADQEERKQGNVLTNSNNNTSSSSSSSTAEEGSSEEEN